MAVVDYDVNDVGAERSFVDPPDAVAPELSLERFEQVDVGALAQLLGHLGVQLALKLLHRFRELQVLLENLRLLGVDGRDLFLVERLPLLPETPVLDPARLGLGSGPEGGDRTGVDRLDLTRLIASVLGIPAAAIVVTDLKVS